MGQNTQTHWPNCGGVGCFVYIADPLCASVLIKFPVHSGRALPSHYRLCVSVRILFLWVGKTNSCFNHIILLFSAAHASLSVLWAVVASSLPPLWIMWFGKFNSWTVFEVMANDVQDDGVCGNDAGTSEDSALIVMTDENPKICKNVRCFWF